MKNMKKIGISLTILSSLILVGCGGGGSSSSSDSLNFPSNSVIAKPTLENGQKVEDATTTNQVSGVLNSIDTTSKLNTALLGSKISKKALEYSKNINLKSYSLNETIDESESCSQGGTINYSGEVKENNGGTITFKVNKCQEDGEIMDGIINMKISNYDSNADDYKNYDFKFISDFTVDNISDNVKVKIFAKSYMSIDVSSFDNYGEMEKAKLSLTLQAKEGSEFYGLKDCTYYIKDNYNFEIYQTGGRVYINNLVSYVDYNTNYDMSKTPFIFKYNDTLISGEAHYNMSNNGEVKIKVESNEAKTYIDADGDGIYELRE